jgi:hypothetical protein
VGGWEPDEKRAQGCPEPQDHEKIGHRIPSRFSLETFVFHRFMGESGELGKNGVTGLHTF